MLPQLSVFIALAALSLSKVYQPGECVQILSVDASPSADPIEIFQFSSIPFCFAKFNKSLSTSIFDEYMQFIPGGVPFLKPLSSQTLCTFRLNSTTTAQFRSLLSRNLVYRLSIRKLPLWGLLGNPSLGSIYTSFHFIIWHRDGRIIEASLTPQNPAQLINNTNIKFSYSVQWESTDKRYQERFDRYIDRKFFKSKVRYYATSNSVVIALFSIQILLYVLTHLLDSDLKRYKSEVEINDFELELQTDIGWKMVHADVFRPPEGNEILSILLSFGFQCFVDSFVNFVSMAFFRLLFRPSLDRLVSFISTELASFIGGFLSGSLSHNWNDNHWQRQTILAAVFPHVSISLLKIISSLFYIGSDTKQSLRPLNSIFILLAKCTISIPLAMIGGKIGRGWSLPSFRVALIPRHIPPTPLYLRTLPLSVIFGLLEFLSIHMECHYLFSSVWHHKIPCAWVFSIVAFISLCIVACCISIVAAYFRLCAENYSWHWSSFLSCAGICFYIILYAIYYYATSVERSGAIQMAHFAAFAISEGVRFGAFAGCVGFISTSIFVRITFKNLKTD